MSNRVKRLALLLAASMAGAAVVAVGVVSVAEEHDPFCAACHMPPERAYLVRARLALAGANPVDLSSAHYAIGHIQFRCIDCHRGDGSLQHRAATLALGAGDALTWLSGQADPALEKGRAARPDLLASACASCHSDTLRRVGFDNHFHNELASLAGNVAAAPAGQPSVTCGHCHHAHVQAAGGREAGFLDLPAVVYPACEICHRERQAGPLDLGH